MRKHKFELIVYLSKFLFILTFDYHLLCTFMYKNLVQTLLIRNCLLVFRYYLAYCIDDCKFCCCRDLGKDDCFLAKMGLKIMMYISLWNEDSDRNGCRLLL